MATSSGNSSEEQDSEFDYGEDPYPGPYFCHTCHRCISRCTRRFTCPICAGGFIEPIDLDTTTGTPGQENMDTEQTEQPAQDENGNNISISINHGSNSSPQQNRPMRRGVRRTRIAIHRIPTNNQEDPTEAIQQFFRDFTAGLLGEGLDLTNNFQLAMPPIVLNADDSLWTRAGLDNILTMFMNQVETAGPPPATKDQIDALPDVVINQSQFDRNLQCNVCMEDFTVGDLAKELPCKHVFHKKCIVPWLELHCTCPICRNRISPSPQEQYRQQQQQDTTTPSSSSQHQQSSSSPTTASQQSSSASTSTPQTSSSPLQQQPPSLLPESAGNISLPSNSALSNARSPNFANSPSSGSSGNGSSGSSGGNGSSSNSYGSSSNSSGGGASSDGLILGALRRLQQELQQRQQPPPPQTPQRYLDDMNLD